MAIQKNIDLENGVTASYIRIKSILKNNDLSRGDESILSVEYYLNDTIRLNKKPIYTENYYIQEVQTFSDAYIELKKLSKFSGAIDC